jgi:hypothetical protein
MSKQLDRAQLKPGASRHCQANRHCAMEGPSFAIPVVSLGRPDAHLTAGCEICGTFVCGGCAKRNGLRLRFGDVGVFAWALMCPLCGSVLGDMHQRRALLHSAHFGPVAALKTSATSWQLENHSDTLDAVQQAITHHGDNSLRLLYTFNTQVSVAGAIRFAEMAVEESPGERVAWLYKALLCGKAGYGIARRHALKELETLGDEHDGESALGHLRLTPDWRPEDGPLNELSKRLTEYDERLAHRAETLFNSELARYHGVIRSYWTADIRLNDVVNQLFPEKLKMTPAVRSFVTGRDMEQSLNFQGVEAERTTFIELMAQVLDEDNLSQLVAGTVAQRLGSISQNDYYLRLRQLAVEAGIDLAYFPALESYFEYISLLSSIEPETFHGDMWDRIQAGYRERIETPEERCVVEEANRICLMRRLVDYCQDRLGVARLQGTYAPRPGAFKNFTRNLEVAAEKPKQSFWQRLFPARSVWRRLFSRSVR